MWRQWTIPWLALHLYRLPSFHCSAGPPKKAPKGPKLHQKPSCHFGIAEDPSFEGSICSAFLGHDGWPLFAFPSLLLFILCPPSSIFFTNTHLYLVKPSLVWFNLDIAYSERFYHSEFVTYMSNWSLAQCLDHLIRPASQPFGSVPNLPNAAFFNVS